MSELRAWLRSVQLENYAQVLETNRVDLDVLVHLTDRDLELLHIPLGDRKRLLWAIGQRGSAVTGDMPLEEYLHHLTVVFVDLVGSTPLSETLDIEDYRATIGAYQRCCSHLIEDHNGFVARYIGDGILAYFGYPRVREDDAEQAVQAGLAIVRAVPRLEVPRLEVQVGVDLQARVGVATGKVLTNQIVAADPRYRDDIFGETPNLAARLQTIAAPSSVVVSGATRRLLGSHFKCADLGPVRLKGFSKPLPAFRVDRVTTPLSRFRARQRASVTPLIGRAGELGLLLRHWRSAAAGEGRVVLVTGEAGIGKSRLLEAMDSALHGQPYAHLRYQCSPYRTRSAFYPIIARLVQVADIEPEDASETKRAKLAKVLEPASGAADQTLKLFARLLSIDEKAPPETTPPRFGATFHERIRTALIEQLARLAGRQPVLVTFEDIHWIDPSSAELLSTLVQDIARMRVMLVCTHRAEYEVTGFARDAASKLHLGRLDRTETARMVRLVSGPVALDAETAGIIADRTEGVPLFIEEMTRSVMEQAGGGEAGGGPGTAPGAALSAAARVLPSTLNDLLAAKLDSLGDANAVTAYCAVLGRSFDRSVLVAVCGLPESQVDQALARLERHHLLVRQGRRREPVYSFRHALIQEIAYALLLKSRRRALHARTAETVVRLFPERARRSPEVVAHHYAEADMPREARDAWLAAANQAIERAAYLEAIQHLQAALQQNARLPDEDERLRTEIALRERLVIPLEARFWGATEIAENLGRLHELQRERGNELDQFAVLHGLYGTHVIGARPDLAMGYAREMARIAASGSQAVARDRPALSLMSRHAMGMCHFVMGEFREAIANYAAAIDLCQGGGVGLVRQFYLADMETVDLCMLAWARALSGGAGETAQAIAGAVRTVEAGAHSFTKAFGLGILASVHQAAGDAASCLACARQTLELSSRYNFRYWEAWAGIMLGWAEVADAGRADGVARLERGLDDYMRTGSRQIVSYAKVLLADCHARLGDRALALRLLDEVEVESEFRAVRFHEPIVRRLRAVLPETLPTAGQVGG